MKRTVSSFTSEHLQQSLQHCNESISYDESTDYGGRPSATGNGHLPHHRDRCDRWVSAHLQQERTDFHVYGLPLQMCMWFWMTRQRYRITCLDELPNASREILQRAKAHSWIRQGVFIKTSRTFPKSSSSFWKSPVKCLRNYFQAWLQSFHSIFFRKRLHRSFPVCLFTERNIRVALPTMYSSGSRPQ